MKKFTHEIKSLLSTVLILTAGAGSLAGCTAGERLAGDTAIPDNQIEERLAGAATLSDDVVSDEIRSFSKSDSGSEGQTSYTVNSDGFSFKTTVSDGNGIFKYDFQYSIQDGVLLHDYQVITENKEPQIYNGLKADIKDSEYEEKIIELVENGVFKTGLYEYIAELLNNIYIVLDDPEMAAAEKNEDPAEWEKSYSKFDTNNDEKLTIHEFWYSTANVLNEACNLMKENTEE